VIDIYYVNRPLSVYIYIPIKQDIGRCEDHVQHNEEFTKRPRENWYWPFSRFRFARSSKPANMYVKLKDDTKHDESQS